MKKTIEGLKAFGLSLAVFLIPVVGYLLLEKFIELYEDKTKVQRNVIVVMQMISAGLSLEFLGRIFGN